MSQEIIREGNALVIKADDGRTDLARISWSPQNDQFVIADHTWVDDSLRGQGIAGKLLDAMVEEMQKEGKYILPLCPYVVEKFKRQPEKYDAINWQVQSPDKKN